MWNLGGGLREWRVTKMEGHENGIHTLHAANKTAADWLIKRHDIETTNKIILRNDECFNSYFKTSYSTSVL
jgi:hypothetical protein